MTIGTGIVVSIGILCATFLAVVIIGAKLADKKAKQIELISEQLLLKKKNKL